MMVILIVCIVKRTINLLMVTVYGWVIVISIIIMSNALSANMDTICKTNNVFKQILVIVQQKQEIIVFSVKNTIYYIIIYVIKDILIAVFIMINNHCVYSVIVPVFLFTISNNKQYNVTLNNSNIVNSIRIYNTIMKYHVLIVTVILYNNNMINAL